MREECRTTMFHGYMKLFRIICILYILRIPILVGFLEIQRGLDQVKKINLGSRKVKLEIGGGSQIVKSTCVTCLEKHI